MFTKDSVAYVFYRRGYIEVAPQHRGGIAKGNATNEFQTFWQDERTNQWYIGKVCDAFHVLRENHVVQLRHIYQPDIVVGTVPHIMSKTIVYNVANVFCAQVFHVEGFQISHFIIYVIEIMLSLEST